MSIRIFILFFISTAFLSFSTPNQLEQDLDVYFREKMSAFDKIAENKVLQQNLKKQAAIFPNC